MSTAQTRLSFAFVVILSASSFYAQDSLQDSLLLRFRDSNVAENERFDALRKLNISFIQRGLWDSAHKYIEEGLAKAAPNSKASLQLLATEAQALMYSGRTLEAIENYETVLEQDSVANDSVFFATTSLGLAMLYSSLDRFEAADSLYLKAIDVLEKEDANIDLLRARNNLALNYQYQDKNDAAAPLFHQVLKAGRGKIPGLEAKVYGNLANGHLAESRHDSAAYYIANALQYVDSTADVMTFLYVKAIEASLLRMTGRLEEAIAAGNEIMQVANSMEYYEMDREMHQHLYKAYEEKGDFENALFHFKAFESWKDSTSNNTLDEAILSAELNLKHKYEMDIKDLEQTKELELERANAEKKTLKIIAWGSVIIGLLIVGALFFFLRKRIESLRLRNTAAESELKALRAQVSPHALSNVFSFAMQLLRKKESDKALSYLESNARLARKILEQSRETAVLLSTEVDFLNQYLGQEQLRHGHFDFLISIEDGIDKENMLIPPLLTQPFVENAVVHGTVPAMHGNIKVHYAKQSDFLICSITDDGPGREEHLKPGRLSFGGRISSEMLLTIRKQFGQEASANYLKMEKGTCVRIALPYKPVFD